MKTFIDGFKRLSEELEISERRLCIELNIDQARLTSARRRLTQKLAVKGMQVEVLMAIKDRFPAANINAFFDSTIKFFTRTESVSTTALLDKLKDCQEKNALLQELLAMHRGKTN